MINKALAYNSSEYPISFALKMALPAITLNATLNNNPELIRQN
jgi:hypothetical protein